MTRGEKWYLGLLAAAVVGLGVLEGSAPRPMDWTPTYSRYHRMPYGGRLVYERLPDLFDGPITTVREPIARAARQRRLAQDTGRVDHIFLSTAFAPEGPDLEQLLRQVDRGDHALIAAERFGPSFADTLGIAIGNTFGKEEMTVRFLRHPDVKEGFTFTRLPSQQHFGTLPEAATVLAVDGRSRPVLVRVPWGRGALLLSSVPQAFSNFNLLKDRNARFMAVAFSHLPQRPVLWDEFLKVGRGESTSPLRWLLAQRALRWAYFLTLALVALYLLYRGKREQRAIPVVPPVRNASREFVRTVGRLYHQKGDHADIARKMIGHFKEEMRARTYLARFGYDAATVDHLARKSGLPATDLRARLDRIAAFEDQRTVSEKQLLELSDTLHDLRNRF